MKDYIKLVGLAKSGIDNGFSRVGRGLNASSRAERALMLSAGRAVALGNAIVLLAQNDHAVEALPLLRQLIECAVAMRWITAADREERGKAVLSQADAWDGLWTQSRDRIKAVSDADLAKLFDEIDKTCANFTRANAQGLPWAHVFDDDKTPGVSAEELLKLAARASGHAVKALDVRWPGKFEGAEQLWEKAK